jgi:ribosomal protein S11
MLTAAVKYTTSQGVSLLSASRRAGIPVSHQLALVERIIATHAIEALLSLVVHGNGGGRPAVRRTVHRINP